MLVAIRKASSFVCCDYLVWPVTRLVHCCAKSSIALSYLQRIRSSTRTLLHCPPESSSRKSKHGHSVRWVINTYCTAIARWCFWETAAYPDEAFSSTQFEFLVVLMYNLRRQDLAGMIFAGISLSCFRMYTYMLITMWVHPLTVCSTRPVQPRQQHILLFESDPMHAVLMAHSRSKSDPHIDLLATLKSNHQKNKAYHCMRRNV